MCSLLRRVEPDPGRLGSRAAQRVASPWRYVGDQALWSIPALGESWGLATDTVPEPRGMIGACIGDRRYGLVGGLLGVPATACAGFAQPHAWPRGRWPVRGAPDDRRQRLRARPGGAPVMVAGGLGHAPPYGPD